MTRVIRLFAALTLALPLATFAQAPNISGRVSSPGGTPIAEVEVRIAGTTKTTRSGTDGAFTFTNAPTGPQVLQFRRVGYLPAQEGVNVPDFSDSVNISLVALSPSLDTVRVSASLNVLAGAIVDDKLRPLDGVAVELVGMRRATTSTDATGAFTFTSVRNGPVVVRAKKAGYDLGTFSVQLDSWRGIVLVLTPLESLDPKTRRRAEMELGNSAQNVWRETDDRLVRRGARAALVPREELAALGGMPLGQAVRSTKSGSLAAMSLDNLSNQACVLLNGRIAVGQVSLNSYSSDQVDFVELYPSGTEQTGIVQKYLRSTGCVGTTQVSSGATRGVYYAVVWMRR